MGFSELKSSSMKTKAIACFILSLFWNGYLEAQVMHPEAGKVFVDDEVPRIDIQIDESSLEAIFDDLGSYDEYKARFIFSSSTVQDTVENVGFRLRGNTSRGANKKSYKISFNTFEPGREYRGLEKMNINGEHNDPSIIRSKMCWDIYGAVGVPASRSNHVSLYVNGNYYGLYTNVEHIDEEFVKKRFTDGSGNLWKCLYPATLEYLGFSPELYKQEAQGRRIYDLKTNKTQDDYSKLAHFIDVINNYQDDQLKCELERIFDVDNYLKVIALDVLTGNWDGYIPNKNNFYLYHDPCTNKINFINYDLDNTFGIDWFGTDWATTDMYDWASYGFGNEDRPLYNRIMNVPEYRDRYSFYMQQIVDEFFNPQILHNYLDEKLALIQSFRVDDPVAGLDYGWSYQDFLDSYEERLGDHVKKGMKEYVEDRVNHIQSTVENNNIFPSVIKIDVDWSPTSVQFNIDGQDDGTVTEIKFFYSFDGVNWNEEVLDVTAEGDAIYNHQVVEEGIMIYYTEITDELGQSRFYPLCQDATERIGYLDTPNFVINELVANNISIKKDDFDEYEDWIELFNATGTVLPVGRFYLTDDPEEPNKWLLPNTALSPNQYLVIWADGDTNQGDRHANFGLKKSGEYVGLYDSKDNHFALIQEIEFPALDADESYARLPNGSGDFVKEPYPTFGYNNDLASGIEVTQYTKLNISPNPSTDFITIDTDLNLNNFNIECVNESGVKYSLKANGNTITTKELPSGIYFLLIQNKEVIHSKKFIIQN